MVTQVKLKDEDWLIKLCNIFLLFNKLFNYNKVLINDDVPVDSQTPSYILLIPTSFLQLNFIFHF